MYKHMYDEGDHAILYAKNRPTYSEYIYRTLLEFYENGKGAETCKYDLAVDVGCGNGQNSRPLCKWFRHVIGCDVSEQQINSANRDLQNLTFKVCPGEKMDFLENNSVDLITTAMSLHWLDIEAFYKEVKRVLRPGGVFAAYSYTAYNGFDDKEANDVVTQFSHGLLGPYWHKRISLAAAQYRTIDIPFEDKKGTCDIGKVYCPSSRNNPGRYITDTWHLSEGLIIDTLLVIVDSVILLWIELDNICDDHGTSVDAYVGYLSSMTPWRAYSTQHPGSQELEHVRDRLKKCYGDRDMKVTWPGCLLLGRKPT